MKLLVFDKNKSQNYIYENSYIFFYLYELYSFANIKIISTKTKSKNMIIHAFKLREQCHSSFTPLLIRKTSLFQSLFSSHPYVSNYALGDR